MRLLKNDIQMFATGEFEADVFYEYIGSPLIESVNVTIKCPAKLGTTIPSGWTKEDDYTLTKVYTEDSTQLVTLYLFTGSSSGSVINVDVNINVSGIGKINTHDQKFYAFGENKSKQEVYTKGDFVLLKKEYVFTNDGFKNFRVDFLFPDDTWNYENTQIISLREFYYNKKEDGSFEINRGYVLPFANLLVNGTGIVGFNENTHIMINPNGFNDQSQEADITVLHQRNSGTTGDKMVFELLLMKVGVEE